MRPRSPASLELTSISSRDRARGYRPSSREGEGYRQQDCAADWTGGQVRTDSCAIMSVDPDVLLADHVAPSRRFGFDELAELLRRARHDLGALRVEPRLHVG